MGADYFLFKRADLHAILSILSAKNTYNPGVDGSAAGQNNDQAAVSLDIRHRSSGYAVGSQIPD
jgi:hypothetical protein